MLLTHVQFVCKSNLIFLCRPALLPPLLHSLFGQVGSAVQARNLLFVSIESPPFFIPFLCFSRQLANPAASHHLQIIHAVLSAVLLINIFKRSIQCTAFYSVVSPTTLSSALLAMLSGFAQHLRFLLFLSFTSNTNFSKMGHVIMNWCLGCISSSAWLSQEHTDQ